MKAQTVTAFAGRFGLSRSTLLYYDRIGLLTPSAHSPAGYRLYTESDARRMQRIQTFRRAGLPLREIREILATGAADTLEAALENRLSVLNEEISRLRAQQRLVVQLLQRRCGHPSHPQVDVEQWVRMLEEAGMDEEARHRWHAAFERDAPQAHREFLRAIGLDESEVREVRRLSAGAWASGAARA
ncbi:MAG: MerR family transcriptional regulator [Ectothiorhodospiraceae bacterium]